MSTSSSPRATTSDQPTEHELQFISSLIRLLGEEKPGGEKRDTPTPDRAALAALRRGLGKSPGEAPEMFPYVIRWCSDERNPRQNDYFLVAALFALHQGTRPPHPTIVGARRSILNSLGGSFQLLASQTGSGSIEKRFVALLNATRPELDNHLRHAIKLMKAHDIKIDWAQLLHDLDGWERTSRPIQRRWASGFWYTETPSTNPAAAQADGPGAPPEA